LDFLQVVAQQRRVELGLVLLGGRHAIS
jgi:hypothetical protein